MNAHDLPRFLLSLEMPLMRFAGGHPSQVAGNFCVAMTTRGGPGIVLASLAYMCGTWFRFVIDHRLELYEGAKAPTGPGEASHGARNAPGPEVMVHP